MQSTVDDTLREESERFVFRFTCEHCVHYTGEACSLGYPVAPHREVDLRTRHSLEFCKSFELG